MCFCSICLKIPTETRYIWLNNCKCFIPVDVLDKHMDSESIRLENTIHGFPEYPQCKSPIYYSMRYSDLIRSQRVKYHEFKKSQIFSKEANVQLMSSISKISSSSEQYALRVYFLSMKFKTQIDFLQNRINLCKLFEEIRSRVRPVTRVGMLRTAVFYPKEIQKEIQSYNLTKVSDEISKLSIELPNEMFEQMAIKLICMHCCFECEASKFNDGKRISDSIRNRFDVNGSFNKEYLEGLYNEIEKSAELEKLKIYKLSDIMKPVL